MSCRGGIARGTRGFSGTDLMMITRSARRKKAGRLDELVIVLGCFGLFCQLFRVFDAGGSLTMSTLEKGTSAMT